MNIYTIIGMVVIIAGIALVYVGQKGKESKPPEFRTDYRGDGMLNISTDDIDIDSIKSVWIYSHKTGKVEMKYFKDAIQ